MLPILAIMKFIQLLDTVVRKEQRIFIICKKIMMNERRIPIIDNLLINPMKYEGRDDIIRETIHGRSEWHHE